MTQTASSSRARRVFVRITDRPRAVVAAAAAAVVACAAFVPCIHQDSRVEAFIPPEEECLVLRDQIRERFGLADPMAFLVVNDGPEGVFTPHTLALVQSLTSAARNVPGIDPRGVVSLATVRVAESTADGFDNVAVVDPAALELAGGSAAAASRALVDRHDVLHGSLVAPDRKSTLVVIERFDSTYGTRIYRELAGIASTADVSAGEKIHVAGHGAITATLGDYIDSDTRVLYVAVTVVIGAVLALAFRTLAGIALPLVLIGATLAVCLGTMGMASAPFTVISSALPVVISALVVTDAQHILSLYYQLQAERPGSDPRDIVVDAMTQLWRPCVSARVTDIAGFAGLYLGTVMPPMKSFGLFGSIAIAGEMALALVAYPCLLVLVAPRPSPAFATHRSSASVAAARRALDSVTRRALQRPALVLVPALVIVVAGLTGIARLVVNDSWAGNFDPGSSVRIATDELDRRHGILTDLDLVVDAGHENGILEPDNLERIHRLEETVKTLPHVTSVHSITGVLRETGRATGGATTSSGLPDSRDLAEQYLLLADRDTRGRWLDEEGRHALIRAHTRARDYLMEVDMLASLRRYLDDAFADGPLRVAVGGMAVVGSAWVSSVGSFHLLSAVLSVGFCWLQMCASFRSLALGSLAIVPMLAAMLLMYAVMGWGAIPLGIGTSMFAALAIGTGVDFAIHTIDRLLVLRQTGIQSTAAAMAEIVPTTGRTILYSAIAIILGFSVLCASSIPAVRSLGVLVTVAVLASLVATFTVLPVLVQLLRPSRLNGVSS